ncbi:MAG: Asp-tRNA(Asn)/Glu-tRNA(Gln) amidotransferase subunit GatA [Leptospirales bacterium]|nr:Asp-tRNA(Asn)/Glu-tRNA(Gln) amidotransferase subunit GatA [Leptospirales bacterium]
MNEILKNTASEHAKALASGEYTAAELAKACIAEANNRKSLDAFNSLDAALIELQAKASDERRKKGQTLGPLDGIPIAVKDNICAKGEKVTCSSKFLENFEAPYDAHVIERLRAAGAVLFGRTNLDEFAMGSSTENSGLRLTKNPWDESRVPGGSSGGSASVVGANIVPLALGSDTGGSIRQPASFCGLHGLKPTYGTVSRYGLVAFASSLDQIGPFARSAEDTALLLNAIAGHDMRDSTSNPSSDKIPAPFEGPLPDSDLKSLRIGYYVPENQEGYSKEVLAACEKAAKHFEQKGATLVPIKSKFWDYSIPIYYILATAEASSNLSRFDGIRYGKRAKGEDLKEVYIRSRTEGFGPEVKRRILLGTFVLSAGYFDAYYGKAQKAKALIHNEYVSFFKNVDFILQPTSPTTAFKIGEKAKNPIAMYQSDVLTIAANLGGVPSMSVPAGLDSLGLPIGLQITGPHFSDQRLIRYAANFAEIPGFAIGGAVAAKPNGSKAAAITQTARNGAGSSAPVILQAKSASKPAASRPAALKKATSGKPAPTAKRASGKSPTRGKSSGKKLTVRKAVSKAGKPAKKVSAPAAKKRTTKKATGKKK